MNSMSEAQMFEGVDCVSLPIKALVSDIYIYTYLPDFLAEPFGIRAGWDIKVNGRFVFVAEWSSAQADSSSDGQRIIDKHSIALELQVYVLDSHCTK